MVEVTQPKVKVTRETEGVYVATNKAGASLRFGPNAVDGFSPVDLLLAAVAGCSAVDVDVVTSRRAKPTRFDVVSEAEYHRSPDGNILQNVRVTFDLEFPATKAGDKARQRVNGALQQSHDKSCTVSRTIEAAVPVEFRATVGESPV